MSADSLKGVGKKSQREQTELHLYLEFSLSKTLYLKRKKHVCDFHAR